jgi:hypothetical protein
MHAVPTYVCTNKPYEQIQRFDKNLRISNIDPGIDLVKGIRWRAPFMTNNLPQVSGCRPMAPGASHWAEHYVLHWKGKLIICKVRGTLLMYVAFDKIQGFILNSYYFIALIIFTTKKILGTTENVYYLLLLVVVAVVHILYFTICYLPKTQIVTGLMVKYRKFTIYNNILS